MSVNKRRKMDGSTHSTHSGPAASIKQESSSPPGVAATSSGIVASAPSVVVQSPATPSATNTSTPASMSSATWPSEQQNSFSRRITSQQPSQRSTPRKLPPSRLTLHPDEVAPAIRSAPPIPVPANQQQPPIRALGDATWITSRSHSRNISNPGEASNGTPSGRHAYPSIPTPTSLRLGHAIIAPQVQGPAPLTPAVPSPLPLGSGTALPDKAKFLQKMSEIYDRSGPHRQCIAIEEVDKRIKDALAPITLEVLALKREILELKRSRQSVTPPAASETPTAIPKPPVLPIINGKTSEGSQTSPKDKMDESK